MTRDIKLRNFKQLIGDFDDDRIEELFKVVERNFDLKKIYSERDWLTKNRQEVPQSFPEYYRNQIQARSNHPKLKRILIVELWTDPAVEAHPFYKKLVDELIHYVQVFFPGVACERYTQPPVELNYQYLKVNGLVKTRVRADTGREQFRTEDLFNVIMRNKL